MARFLRGPAILLAGFALIGAAAGLIFRPAVGWATFAVLLAAAWANQALNQARLLDWLKHPDAALVPRAVGRWDDIYAALYRHFRAVNREERDLAQRLDRFRQAGAAMPDGVVILGPREAIEWCNPMAEQFLGITLNQDGGQQITYILRQPEFVAYLSGHNYREPLVLRGYRKPEQTLQVQLVPYGDDQKLLICRDITRWERIETMRRDFVANVSHELRTPLTVVGGFVETLADLEGMEPAVVRRSLQLMSEQTGRMQRLVEDLLTLTRLEGSSRLPGDDPVNMPALIQSLAADAQHLSRGRHRITLRECAPAALKGAEDELRSALGNLLSNAVRYTPDGGVIDIRWQVVNDEGVFSVSDTGMGIAPEHIPRLTERFYRVDRSRSRETGGTGLGLAIAKHVLNRHQARLEIHSTVGQGSTFSAIFPPGRIAPLPARAASGEAVVN